GRGDPDPHRRTQPLYCAWHTRHRARRVNPSGVRGSLHIIRFVQQSRYLHQSCVNPPSNSGHKTLFSQGNKYTIKSRRHFKISKVKKISNYRPLSKKKKYQE
ncbi:hypothetical protein, partial [Pseudophaeobacter sp.]|uniref:hypothetical protein n=1 Tax=Pseudophaeobacter sp. TaxID=1971739 RepID=UPI0040599998